LFSSCLSVYSYYSPTYDPSRAFSLQVEWLSVMFVAVRVITCFWKVFNVGGTSRETGAYEASVASGFCPINWIDLALVGALVLCQLFVMLGNFVLGYLLCYALLWIAIVMAFGFQEHQNKIYAIVNSVARGQDYSGEAVANIRKQRIAYYGLIWIPLFCALALLGAQAAYDSIKGATDLPGSLKAYVAVTMVFVVALTGNIAYNIIKSGEARNKDETVHQHQVQDAIFGLLMFLWSSAAVAFVFSIMHYNNNLSFELSTPLQTIN